MGRYIITRLLWFIPALFFIAFLAFIISINAPGDPAERYLSAQLGEGDAQASGMNRKEEIKKIRDQWGLNLPIFYFSLTTQADHAQLKELSGLHAQSLRAWMRQTGKRDLLWDFDVQLNNFSFLMDSNNIKTKELKSVLDSFYINFDWNKAAPFFKNKLKPLLSENPAAFQSINNVFLAVEKAETKGLLAWIPKLGWNGATNQFHHWVAGNGKNSQGLIRGDFGISLRDGQSIGKRIGSRVKWSLGLSLLATFLAYLISIPIGVYAGYNKNSWFDNITSKTLFILYTLPVFFVATALLVVFANPDVFDWFPASGVRDPQSFNPNWNFGERLAHYAPYLFLPIIAYTYNLLAFIARQTRGAIIQNYQMPYIQTARAKGLSERTILWKHAFRNSLIPLITLLSSLIPAAFAGSLVIEIIFNIPGMGLEIYEATLANDYPTIVAVFTLFGFFTLLFNLLADVAYALADPRIQFQSKK